MTLKFLEEKSKLGQPENKTYRTQHNEAVNNLRHSGGSLQTMKEDAGDDSWLQLKQLIFANLQKLMTMGAHARTLPRALEGP